MRYVCWLVFLFSIEASANFNFTEFVTGYLAPCLLGGIVADKITKGDRQITAISCIVSVGAVEGSRDGQWLNPPRMTPEQLRIELDRVESQQALPSVGY